MQAEITESSGLLPSSAFSCVGCCFAVVIVVFCL